ncbi:dioxygenase family protein [Fuscibacter oryzae]|uniref:Intradiol ring-cleavage dioxygenases domain-containing protein n=1 Tax=Fuscibacter oryzae TaxID=2803939 RepID=A0A8J7MTF2_9RHOB|nr:hypothetical protein [Fuscibacter oryzae]MBL4930033.1 hypothetical protein [Fuscibacter oryzae]
MTQDDDGSFRQDHARLWGRRAALGALVAGAAGAGWWFTGPPGQSEPNLAATGADGAACLKLPEETNGPYPADGTNRLNGATVNVLTESGVMRRDLRPSFGGLTSVADGALLELEIRLVDVKAACAPLAGLAVYLWHCDAAGDYSIYGRAEANYLRGLQESDASGVVRFTTIFPGTYQGRWPHIHFEVFASASAAVSGTAALLTSQIAMPGAAAQALYLADARYAGSIAPLAGVTFEGDWIFGDNTPEQRAAQLMRLSPGGVDGLVTVGVLRA